MTEAKVRKGKIIKGIGGFYYVSDGNTVYSCRAKGILRLRDQKPMIGDDVEFSVTDEASAEGNVENILPSRNHLIRPAIANVDEVWIVQSVAHPAPQLYLLDRYLLSMELQNLPVTLVWNKADLGTGTERFLTEYRDIGYPVFLCSAKSGEGIGELRQHLQGKSVALAGPSGVGKSTITNLLCPSASMATGGISRKIERGKHTTRHSEFFTVGENTFLCDTPGFTAVSFTGLSSENLRFYFPELSELEGKCRFHGCLHLAEPDCAVKNELEAGRIAGSRYDSYQRIYAELNEVERRFG